MDVWKHAHEHKYFLIGIFFLSCLLRMLLFAGYTSHEDHAWLAFDSEQYELIARQIAAGDGISNQDGTPNFYRLPGYPLYLAGCYKIFNDHTHAALWLQVLLSSFIPLLIFFLSLTLLPSQLLIAQIASCVAAVHVGFMLYAGMLSTESLFLIFFLLFLICFYAGLQNASSRFFACAGAFLGIASLIRPVGHYSIIIALAVLLMFYHKNTLSKAIPLTASWLIVISPWLIRNYLLAGTLFFHTLPGLHFLQYSAAAIEQARIGCDYFQARDNVFAVWHGQVAKQEQLLKRPVTEYERFAVAQNVAFYYMTHYPKLFFKHACTQIARTCGTLYSTLFLYVPAGTTYGNDMTVWSKIKLYLFPRAVHSLLIPLIYWEMISYLLMLLGCVMFLAQAVLDRSLRWVLVKTLPFMAMFIVITLAYGCARLRFAVEPCMIVLAAYAWTARVRSWRKDYF